MKIGRCVQKEIETMPYYQEAELVLSSQPEDRSKVYAVMGVATNQVRLALFHIQAVVYSEWRPGSWIQ